MANSSPAIPPRFLVDCMLGRLARWLRILGYDTIWLDRDPKTNLASLAAQEGRLLLTRRTAYQNDCALFISHDRVDDQLRQVVNSLGLDIQSMRLTRCTVCNHPLLPLQRETARPLVPPHVAATAKEFRHCANCGRIYLEGTHCRRICAALSGILRPAESPVAEVDWDVVLKPGGGGIGR